MEACPRAGGTYLIFVESWTGAHFVRQTPKPVTTNVPEEHFGKSAEQIRHLGTLIWFWSGLEKGVFLNGRAQKPVTRNMPKEQLGKSGEPVQDLGDLSDFCRVLKGRSFCKAGPGTCHKECAQGTFWKKLGAGPTPGGTYLIFVWFWEGGHFAR